MKYITPYEKMDILQFNLDKILSEKVIKDVGNLVMILDLLYGSDNDDKWYFRKGKDKLMFWMKNHRLILINHERRIIQIWRLDD